MRILDRVSGSPVQRERSPWWKNNSFAVIAGIALTISGLCIKIHQHHTAHREIAQGIAQVRAELKLLTDVVRIIEASELLYGKASIEDPRIHEAWRNATMEAGIMYDALRRIDDGRAPSMPVQDLDGRVETAWMRTSDACAPLQQHQSSLTEDERATIAELRKEAMKLGGGFAILYEPTNEE
jgi:hypothetical protein